MPMKKPLAAVVFTLVFAGVAEEAAAIPAFARRYGAQCVYCHQGFPKLTYEGQRFKERGFRMPSEEGFDASKWIASVPVVGRGWVNRLQFESDDNSGTDDGFTTGFLKAISAGNLGGRLSYWADDSWLVRERPANAPAAFDRVTHLKPNNLWARFELARAGKLYLKAGRFELDLPFTQIRSPHLFSYDIYSVKTGSEADDVASFQDGAELGATFAENWHASLAVVKGRNNASQEDNSGDVDEFDANVFLRAARRVDRHRLGAFAYFGKNTLAPSRQAVFENQLQRYGLDADVWVGKLNLYGVFLHGRDGNSSGNGAAQTFDGGFAQADWHARDNLVLSTRLNVVNRLAGSAKSTFTGLVPGARLYLFRHARVAVEYSFLNDPRGQSRRNFGAVQAELVF
jgi:hypothetical protein